MARIITSSPEETREWGRKIGSRLPPNSVVCFFGNLAAGKTTFIKGLVEGAASLSQEEVISPTFVYLNIYQGVQTIYHFDLYRLHGAEEFLSMGFDDYFSAGGITCIEWAEKIETILPDNVIRIEMRHEGENRREIRISDGMAS